MLVYILSTGAYVWLADRLNSSAMLDASETLYAPLIWLTERSDLFEFVIRAYLGLWIDIPVKPY